jgi:hypothetical protein
MAVEPYLQRCFPGIKKIGVNREWGFRIQTLISPEGECLDLQNPVNMMVGSLQIDRMSLMCG